MNRALQFLGVLLVILSTVLSSIGSGSNDFDADDGFSGNIIYTSHCVLV
jgi:hypothetical protein